jgi:hypothetical protein
MTKVTRRICRFCKGTTDYKGDRETEYFGRGDTERRRLSIRRKLPSQKEVFCRGETALYRLSVRRKPLSQKASVF